ncbi:hypothetical protein B0O80DRAFT_254462 [Mortierella sp. GBAus27b]|nr:hypothetical protein B0O80DRAFT_254462 [Mortierella sp. GBAus27b]
MLGQFQKSDGVGLCPLFISHSFVILLAIVFRPLLSLSLWIFLCTIHKSDCICISFLRWLIAARAFRRMRGLIQD